MKKNSTFLAIALIAILAMISCEQNQTEKSFSYEPNESSNPYATFIGRNAVSPPLKGIDTPFETFVVNNSEEQHFDLDNGTHITVPANAFVTSEGTPVEGDVQLHYREFHDAAAVLASGIPMSKSSANGEIETFLQTAGMIEMQATDANNQAVFLAENSAIQIDMASHTDGDGYDFLALDEAGNWETLAETKAVKNPKRIELNKAIAKLAVPTPVKPIKLDKTKPVLDFDINLAAYPKLSSISGLIWQYNGTDDAKNPIKNTWVLEHNWESANIEPTKQAGIYTLLLKGGGKSFKTTVCPSLKEAEYNEALADYNKNLKEYKKNALTAEKKQMLVEKQAAFRRSFSISGMGIYNCDRFLRSGDYMAIKAKFEVDENIPNLDKYMQLFHISFDGRAVIPYNNGSWNNINLDQKLDNKFIAILPNNKIATFSQEDFDNAMEDIVSTRSYTFKLKITDQEINSTADLQNLLDKNS